MITSDIHTGNTAEGLETSSESSTRVTAPSTVTMDPDGDLILRVGSDPAAKITDFKVCPATLRRNSPVFKAMLYGPWSESKPPSDSESQWTVSLPDDDPSGMQIILDIVHGNFDKVPVTPRTHDLYHVVVTADKYDMFRCLRPWAADWREKAVQNLNSFFQPLFVHVAWELGDEAFYVKGLRNLAMRSCLVLEHSEGTVSEDVTDRTLWFRRSMQLEEAFAPLFPSSRCGPLDIADVIAEYRLKDIQELLDFFHAQVTGRAALRSDRQLPDHACKFPDGDTCDASILGNIWRGIIRQGREGFPKQAEEAPEESVNSLLSVFSALFKMPQSEWVTYCHEQCSPHRAFEEIDNRLWSASEWRNRLLRDHDKEHLAKRRQILGLDMGDSNVNANGGVHT